MDKRTEKVVLAGKVDGVDTVFVGHRTIPGMNSNISNMSSNISNIAGGNLGIARIDFNCKTTGTRVDNETIAGKETAVNENEEINYNLTGYNMGIIGKFNTIISLLKPDQPSQCRMNQTLPVFRF
jgi:hypothetical protein